MPANSKSPILDKLNPDQEKAVTHWGSPLLILAGAGSGKTRALTHRAAWLIIEKDFAPEQLVLLTFTNKAAGAMKERILKLLASQMVTGSPYAGTFHSFSARVLRESGKYSDIPPGFVIYDTNDQIDIVKEVFQILDIDPKRFSPQSALSAISNAKNELIDPAEYSSLARGEWQTRAALVYTEYQKFLKKNEALDFDDLLFETVKLFKTVPEVLKKYQTRYKYVLVDEWQDTNKAQYAITKFLVKEHEGLTCVGDAAQSVYSWRGADFRNLTYLEKDFPNLTTVNLEQNYRSTQKILDAAYSVISRNKSHPILRLWTENAGGERIKLYQARSELDEASFVAREIQEQTRKGVSFSEMAVLYRTNAQSRVVEEALLHEGIPYILVGAVRFYERKEIKDVLAYLRLLTAPGDTVARKRIEKLGKGRMQRFDSFVENEYGEKFADGTSLEVLDKVLQVTGLLDLYDQENAEDLNRLENIKELRSVATEFAKLPDFLEQVILAESVQNSKGTSQFSGITRGDAVTLTTDQVGAVTLMTAHAAKGLEFTAVFVVGLEEGLFPHSRALMDAEELEE
ncbi:MAG: UvrD-helicase domain-containing protein [bacterium]|nr:UvrD-helicase domain-containing protein [bacterium]